MKKINSKNKIKSENVEYDDDTLKNQLDALQTKKIDSSGNGYIKYSDGTLICYGKTTSFNVPATSYNDLVLDCPSVFDATAISPIVIGTMSAGGLNWSFVNYKCYYDSVNNKIIVQTWNNTTHDAEAIVIGYIAIGRWK